MTDHSVSRGNDDAASRSVFGYVRVSTDRQETERQQETLPARHGSLPDGLSDLPLELFYDQGISAWSGKARPDFEKMMERVRAGHAAAIIIDTSSRLTRQGIRAALSLLRTFQDADCRLFTTQGREYTFDVQGYISLIIDAEGDERYSSTLSHNISSGKAAKAKAGQWHHGDTPPGYRFNRETKDLESTPDLPLITEAGLRALNGETNRQVSAFLSATLSEEALVRKKNSRPYVSPDRLRGILENPLYAGYIVYHREEHPWKGSIPDEWVRGTHEAAWPLETFEAIQRLLQRRKNRNASRTPRTWAFSGIAKCHICGGSLRDHPTTNRYGRKYRYVRCSGQNCEGNKRLPILAVWEANVLTGLAAIAAALDDVLGADEGYGAPEARESIEQLRKSKDAANERVRTILKQIILHPGIEDDPEVAAEKQRAIRELDAIEARLTNLVTEGKSLRDDRRDLAGALLSLGQELAADDPWAGYIAEETVTLIDEKHGRGTPDVQSYSIAHEGRTRPTAMNVLAGWRAAEFETQVNVLRQTLREVRSSTEGTEYHFAYGFDAPITISAPFESKRSPVLAALQENGFGRETTKTGQGSQEVVTSTSSA